MSIAATPRLGLGRYVFGAAAVLSGIVMLVWHDGRSWALVFACAVGVGQVLGGAAIQFPRAARAGAGLLVAAYLAFALSCIPAIVTTPLVYNSWGNFFEQFSLVIGAAIVYARSKGAVAPKAMPRVACVLFGACTVSFALEQAVYLKETAGFVPAWIPPSPMFWAVATTLFFALAALALMTNRVALPAARSLTVMLAGFGLLVWVPILRSDPHSHFNWSETAETFAIAGIAWMLADLLAARGERP